jgi:hypothetical protein
MAGALEIEMAGSWEIEMAGSWGIEMENMFQGFGQWRLERH